MENLQYIDILADKQIVILFKYRQRIFLWTFQDFPKCSAVIVSTKVRSSGKPLLLNISLLKPIHCSLPGASGREYIGTHRTLGTLFNSGGFTIITFT